MQSKIAKDALAGGGQLRGAVDRPLDVRLGAQLAERHAPAVAGDCVQHHLVPYCVMFFGLLAHFNALFYDCND